MIANLTVGIERRERPAAPANAIDAAAVDEGIMSRVIAVAAGYDFVVVDTFPLLDSVTLAILDMSDLAFVVLNDSAPTVNGRPSCSPFSIASASTARAAGWS